MFFLIAAATGLPPRLYDASSTTAILDEDVSQPRLDVPVLALSANSQIRLLPVSSMLSIFRLLAATEVKSYSVSHTAV